jgi:hypothetical protein
MYRSAGLSVVSILVLASYVRAQEVTNEDISDLSLVFTVVSENLSREHNRDAVRKLLDTVKEPLRGTPYRLIEHLAAQPDPKSE